MKTSYVMKTSRSLVGIIMVKYFLRYKPLKSVLALSPPPTLGLNRAERSLPVGIILFKELQLLVFTDVISKFRSSK